MRINNGKQKKKYLIALEETRSIVALTAGLLIFIFALSAIFVMAVNVPNAYEYPLHYFTVWSNIMSAVAAAFMIPYAVEGIRKKRFVLPRWIVVFQYAGANCVAVTLISALGLILPTQGLEAVSGENFWLHIVTPALTLILFQCVETGVAFTRRDSVLVLIPYWIYMIVYFIMVILIGEKNGGWSDFYLTQAFWPAWVSAILMITVGFVISFLLSFVHNKLAAQSWSRIKKMWGKDLQPTELLIEVFGLGRYMGAKCADFQLTVPMDIFEVISEQYDIPIDKLTKAYFKGALDAFEERNTK